MYNPEKVEGKRPRKGEIWTPAKYPALDFVIIHGRYTVSVLMALGRRKKLSECEDLHSMVMYGPLDWTAISFANEVDFVNQFKFVKKAKYEKNAGQEADDDNSHLRDSGTPVQRG